LHKAKHHFAINNLFQKTVNKIELVGSNEYKTQLKVTRGVY